jgi:hypothetical protein
VNDDEIFGEDEEAVGDSKDPSMPQLLILFTPRACRLI